MLKLALKFEPLPQLLPDWVEFIWPQVSQPAYEFCERNRVNLLQVKGSFFKEWFGASMFPSVAAQSVCVRPDGHHGQFVVRWIVSQEKAGPHLGGHSQVNDPNLTGARLRHRRSPACPTVGRLAQWPAWPIQVPRALPPTQIPWGQSRDVRRASASEAHSEFLSRSSRKQTTGFISFSQGGYAPFPGVTGSSSKTEPLDERMAR